MAATAFVLAIAADVSWVAAAITAATAGVAYWTKINPLWIFGLRACRLRDWSRRATRRKRF